MKKSISILSLVLLVFSLYSYKASAILTAEKIESENSDSIKLLRDAYIKEMEKREKQEIELLKLTLKRLTSDSYEEDYLVLTDIMKSANVKIYYLNEKNNVELTRNLGEKRLDTTYVNGQVRKLRLKDEGFKFTEKITQKTYYIYFDHSDFLDSLKSL